MAGAIVNVWTVLITWFSTTFPSIAELFYDSAESSLTFLGILCVMGLGIGVFFLLVGVIQNFLHFRS